VLELNEGLYLLVMTLMMEAHVHADDGYHDQMLTMLVG
jgi:hypothetical protein